MKHMKELGNLLICSLISLGIMWSLCDLITTIFLDKNLGHITVCVAEGDTYRVDKTDGSSILNAGTTYAIAVPTNGACQGEAIKFKVRQP